MKRFLQALLALGAVAAGLAPVVHDAAAAATPTVTIVPGHDVFDDQFVEVRWSGFPASTPDAAQGVSISQCSGAPVKPDDTCAASVLGISDATGAGTTTIQVNTGELPSRNFRGTFTCDHDTACTIGVYTSASKPFGGTTPSATAPLTFIFPPSSCPHTEAGISGSGVPASNRAILRWQASLCQAPTSLDATYIRTESLDGREAFIGDRPELGEPQDFAITSERFSAEELERLADAGREVSYAPITASGLEFVFVGYDRVSGQQLPNLTLTPSALAHIFNGTRNSLPTTATDAESTDIIDLNPGVNFKPGLTPFGRLDRASDSLALTSWFLENAATAWQELPPWVADRKGPDGVTPMTAEYAHPTDLLPDGLQGPGVNNQMLNGPDLLALTITGRGPAGQNPETMYMGYLDSSVARFYGLRPVCVQMDPNWRTSGTPCVTATADAITRAVAAATRHDDGTVTPDYSPSDRAAYPILQLGYLAGTTHWTDKTRAAALKTLIDFAVGDGQGDALPQGYGPLPADLVATSRSAAEAILADAPTAPPTTTTTAPPTTTPTGGGGCCSSGGFGGGFTGGGGGSSPGGGRLDVGDVDDGVEVPGPREAEEEDEDDEELSGEQAIEYEPSGGRLSSRTSGLLLVGLTLLAMVALVLRPSGQLQALRVSLVRRLRERGEPS